MSETGLPDFLVVTEGDTDFPVIKEIVLSAVSPDAVVTWVHPEPIAGGGYAPPGSGWEGVRGWCRQCARDHAGLAGFLALGPLDRRSVLILHVDADVAEQASVDCAKPCPPAADTVDALREAVLAWAGEQSVPEGAVLCIPSMATEAWVAAALYPRVWSRLRDPECRRSPDTLLVSRKEKLVRRHGGEYDKDTHAYRNAAPRVAAEWQAVCERCTQAQRFSDELAACVQE